MSISKLISIILHPIFMPLLALYISLSFVPELEFPLNQNLTLIYLIVVSSTIVFPLIFILFLVKIKQLSSLEMTHHKERTLPLFITSLSMSLGYFCLENLLIFTPLLKSAFLSAIFIIIFTCFISWFWKISLHMLGIGGILGLFIALQIIYKNMNDVIIVFIFLSGMLAFARLNEKAHSRAQIYVGFFLGILIELFIILI